MKILYLLVFIVLSKFSISQSLSPERVKKIKEATVRVFLDNGASSGTGFFIDNKGTIATCWHVVDSAYYNKKNISFQMRSFIVDSAFIDSNINIGLCEKYDFCILHAKNIRSSSFLNLGILDSSREGAAIYSCGYPLGIPIQFVT